jgi:hypothetical protein
MKNKYKSPNIVYRPSVQKLMLLATSLFTATATAQEVPQLFSNNDMEKPTKISQTELAEAEQIIFDIYSVGRYQGAVLVRFTDNWVMVENPNDILDQLPKVKNVEAFRPLFQEQIMAKTGKTLDGIGSVSVDPLNFKMDISIASEQAIASDRNDIPTLTGSTANHVSLASRLRLTGSTDFSPGADDRLGLFHNLSMSRAGWRGFMSGNLVKGEGYDFSNMFIEHDVGRTVYGIGMLQTQGASLIASENIYGVQISSNQRGYGDLAELNATPIDVFIPSRSKVRIYRNETQLIYTADHDFGLQNLSTKRFPTGSYEIRIEISENNGTVTEERRFFNKSGRLIPRGLPEYSLSVGINRNDLEFGDKPVYQLNYAARLLDDLEFSTNLYGIDGSFVLEPKLSGFFGNGYEYNAALSFTSDSDVAFLGSFSYVPTNTDQRLSWYMRYTETIMGHDHLDEDLTEDDLFKKNLANERSIFSADMTYRMDKVTWSFSAQRSKNFNADATYSYGPSLAWRLYYRNGHQINANANLTKTRDDANHGLFLNYRYKPLSTNWDYRATAGRANVGARNYNQLNQNVNYDNRQGDKFGTSMSLNHNGQFEGDNNSHTSNAFITHDMKKVGVSANYQRSESSVKDTQESLDYQLDSDILVTQDDLLNPEKRDMIIAGSRGGRNNNIIVSLKGNAVGQRMDLNLNGVRKATLEVGEKVAFDIPDYTGAKITITPAKDSSGLLDYDEAAVQIKLYPGNIASQEWVVNKLYLLSGRAVDANGNPLAWQNIKGARNYVTTDSDGYFQMELLGNEVPYVNTGKHQCVLALPMLKKEEQFVQTGDIICG